MRQNDQGAKEQISQEEMQRRLNQETENLRTVIGQKLEKDNARGDELIEKAERLDEFGSKFQTFAGKKRQGFFQKFFANVKEFFIGIYNGIRGFISSIGKKETVNTGDLAPGVPGSGSAGRGYSGPTSAGSVQQLTKIEQQRMRQFNALQSTYSPQFSGLTDDECSVLQEYAQRGCTEPPEAGSDAMKRCIKLIFTRLKTEKLLAEGATKGVRAGGKAGELRGSAERFAEAATNFADGSKPGGR